MRLVQLRLLRLGPTDPPGAARGSRASGDALGSPLWPGGPQSFGWP